MYLTQVKDSYNLLATGNDSTFRSLFNTTYIHYIYIYYHVLSFIIIYILYSLSLKMKR